MWSWAATVSYTHLCVVPAKLDDGTPVYINLFSQKAFKYESGKQIQVDLPDIGHRFQGLIEAMSEAIAETLSLIHIWHHGCRQAGLALCFLRVKVRNRGAVLD